MVPFGSTNSPIALICVLSIFAAAAKPSQPSRSEEAPPKRQQNTEEATDEDESPQIESSPKAKYRVETVYEQARKSANSSDFPSGFTTKIEISDDKPHADFEDVIHSIPGTNLSQTSSMHRPARLGIRGGDGRQHEVAINGIRVSMPTGLGFDLNSLTRMSLDHLELHRGPGGVQSGPGALTGSLSLDVDPPSEPGTLSEAMVHGGDNGDYSVSGRLETATEDKGLELSAQWLNSPGDFEFVDRQGVRHRRVNNQLSRLSGVATGAFETHGHRFQGTVLHQSEQGGVPGPSEFQRQFSETRLRVHRTLATTQWENKSIAGDNDTWSLDFKTAIGGQKRDSSYRNDETFPGDTSLSQNTDFRSLEINAKAALWLNWGNLTQLRLRGRVSDYHSRIRRRGVQSAHNLDASRMAITPTLSNELMLFDESVSLVGHVGWTSVSNRNRARGQQKTGDRNWSSLLPGAGVILRIKPWLKIKSSVARNFRPPDFDELYLQMTGLEGDPTLSPERALSWDAGLVLGGGNRNWSLQTAYFQNRIDRTIEFVAKSAWLYRATNVSESRARGIELSGDWSLWDKQLWLGGNYTWTDSTWGTDKRFPMPGQPNHRLQLKAKAEMVGLAFETEALDSLTIEGRYHHRSRVHLDAFGNMTSPPSSTVDASLSAAPSDWLHFGLEVKNVTDQMQRADMLQRPLPGRTLYGTLTLKRGDTQ